MLTVDANVWVAAADQNDLFFTASRNFLTQAARQRLNIYLPAFTQIEIACALARKRQDAEAGRQLATAILGSPQITHVQLDASFLAQAILTGTESFLRGADALYAATAAICRTQLISWDDELVRRAGAITPTDWLAENTETS
jgi:predicted nucleic acid-binding protein